MAFAIFRSCRPFRGGPCRAASHCRAFTLMEVLITISVIGLLMGLLLPSLAGVRTHSMQLECQTNLRQMAIAATQYASLWGRYPTAIRYEIVDDVPRSIAWDWETTYNGDALIGPGPLWSFTDNPDTVMQCPAYNGSTSAEADPYTGYNYNTSFIGGEAMWVEVGWDVVRPGLPAHVCRRTATTAIFGCGGYAGGTNKFMRAPTSPNDWPLQMIYSGGQAYHYFNNTNVAYLDAHVGSRGDPKKGAHATPELLANHMGFPDNGFLSDGDDAYDPR